MNDIEEMLQGVTLTPVQEALIAEFEAATRTEAELDALFSNANSETPTGFSYDGLPADVIADARQVAGQFREHLKATVITAIEIGTDLLRVKGKLPHGQFGGWLAAEFGSTARTAQNYMRAAEEFGGQREMVSHLPPTTVYKLAAPSTPGSVREQVIAAGKAGNPMSSDEILVNIGDARRAERAKLPPEKRRDQAEQDAGEAKCEVARSRFLAILEEQLDSNARADIAALASELLFLPGWLTDWARSCAPVLRAA